ncbi:MAG TPA: 3'-5' exonuclease [Bacteroidales bacterium]|nr:3'-5' exonuclease [Bacteroidales bacterium]
MEMEDRKYPEEISVEELAGFELSWFKGEIVLVDDMETFRRIIPRLKKSIILGFDTETKPSFRKGRKNKVSLLQLATADLACLFRINKIGMPDELVSLLSDKKIIKAGVAIHDDIRFLSGIRNFIPAGFIDLQSLVKDFGIKCSGLKKLCAIILGFRISKRQQVTDWEAEELSEAQQVYAATDAWVCHEIYVKLKLTS